VGVADHREVRRGSLRLLDVVRPPAVTRHRIHAEADHLDVALLEIRFELGHVAELGRAHRREVLRMRKDDRPRIADPVVELDAALCRVCLEIRRHGADSKTAILYCETHGCPPATNERTPTRPCGKGAWTIACRIFAML